MSAFNVVRFRVKPGREQEFIDRHKFAKREFRGFEHGALVKTGDRSFCFIGQWRSAQDLAEARPKLVGILDGMRGLLEDLGGGMGVTDPVSGEAVVEITN